MESILEECIQEVGSQATEHHASKALESHGIASYQIQMDKVALDFMARSSIGQTSAKDDINVHVLSSTSLCRVL